MVGVVGVVLVTPLLMLYWFVRRGWLAPSESRSWKHSLAPEAVSQKPQRQGGWEEITSRKFPRRESVPGDGSGGER